MTWKLKAVNMLGSIISSGKNEFNKESKNYSSLFKKTINYPITLIATFLLAPFLLVKVIIHSESTFFRKTVAVTGLILAALSVYFLTTSIIIGVGLFIKAQLGWFSTIAYVVSVFVTTWVSVLIQVGIFNTISTLTLKMTQKDVLNNLREQVDDN